MLNKQVSEYNNVEIVKVFDYVRNYMKDYKEDLIIDNRKVRYIDYYIVNQIEDTLYGFMDELVYVYKQYEDDKYTGEYYIGMREKDFSLTQMKHMLEGIDYNKLQEIITVSCANKALTEFNRR